MTKLEYLEILEQKLKKAMSQKEVNDIIRDYAEYFEDGKSQGKGDDEIAAKLGFPEDVAKQILEENNIDTYNKSGKERLSEKFSSMKNGFSKFFVFFKNIILKFFKGTGKLFKNIFHGSLKFIKRLNIPNVIKYIMYLFIGIPLVLAAILIIVFAAIALIFFLAALIIVGFLLFIPAIILMAVSGFSIEFFHSAVPVTIIISGIGILALGICLICLAFLICQNIKRAFAKKFHHDNPDSFVNDPCEELNKPNINFDNYNEISEGSENND